MILFFRGNDRGVMSMVLAYYTAQLGSVVIAGKKIWSLYVRILSLQGDNKPERDSSA